ncbi:hypothetical protein VKT23_001890 [Stygiomarasmius scandens]|uniref:Uncharacterized protein n=1 Tax=Marasmiellus scandens TaxID=2682957 RepID=A0ABR1K3Z1_9AGAR
MRYGDYRRLRELEERQEAGQSISTGIPSFSTQKLTQESAQSLPSPPTTSEVEGDAISIHDDHESIVSQPIRSRSHTPLTFGALASPRATPQPTSVPASPNFDMLVANATRGTKRKLNFSHVRSDDSQSSQDSTQSQELVAQQLTQVGDNSDDDHGVGQQPEDKDDSDRASNIQRYSGELNWSAHTQNRTSQDSPTSSRLSSPKPTQTYGRNSRQPSNATQTSSSSSSQPMSPLKHHSFPTEFRPQQWYSFHPLSFVPEEDMEAQQDSQSSESHDSSRISSSSRSMKNRQDSPELLDSDYEVHQSESFPMMTQAPYQSQTLESQAGSYPLMTQIPYQSQPDSQ